METSLDIYLRAHDLASGPVGKIGQSFDALFQRYGRMAGGAALAVVGVRMTMAAVTGIIKAQAAEAEYAEKKLLGNALETLQAQLKVRDAVNDTFAEMAKDIPIIGRDIAGLMDALSDKRA